MKHAEFSKRRAARTMKRFRHATVRRQGMGFHSRFLVLNSQVSVLGVQLRRAFTLVELMVVIVILGLLASLVTVAVNDYLVAGKQAVAKSEIAQISNALQLFYTEYNRYPTNDEGLAFLQKKTRTHPNGILQGDLLDPWGHEYLYVYPGLHGTFDVISYGANGQEGGEGADADIVSWDLEGSSEDA